VKENNSKACKISNKQQRVTWQSAILAAKPIMANQQQQSSVAKLINMAKAAKANKIITAA